MSYVDEYREMVSASNVVIQASNDNPYEVFSYPAYSEGSLEAWPVDYETVTFYEDDDWRENDCAG